MSLIMICAWPAGWASFWLEQHLRQSQTQTGKSQTVSGQRRPVHWQTEWQDLPSGRLHLIQTKPLSLTEWHCPRRGTTLARRWSSLVVVGAGGSIANDIKNFESSMAALKLSTDKCCTGFQLSLRKQLRFDLAWAWHGTTVGRCRAINFSDKLVTCPFE